MPKKKNPKKHLLEKLIGIKVKNDKDNLNNGSYLTHKKTKTDALDKASK